MFALNQIVKHPVFGQGKINNVSKGTIKVDFGKFEITFPLDTKEIEVIA